MSLLEDKFVSSWSLVKDLEALKEDSTQPDLAQKAKTFLEEYSFPVIMLVALPNGTIVHKINANDFLDDSSSLTDIIMAGSEYKYLEFLKTGMQQAESSMN